MPRLAESRQAALQQAQGPVDDEQFNALLRDAVVVLGLNQATDPQGRLVELAAEGPELRASAGFTMREVRADPADIAELVRWLQDHAAKPLHGIIWYRLPLAEDRLNWHWRTLEAVIQAGKHCFTEKPVGVGPIRTQADGGLAFGDCLIDTPRRTAGFRVNDGQVVMRLKQVGF